MKPDDHSISQVYHQPYEGRTGQSEFPVTLGDLGDQKYFYQWNSEKRK